jgi:hypothetical protein
LPFIVPWLFALFALPRAKLSLLAGGRGALRVPMFDGTLARAT